MPTSIKTLGYVRNLNIKHISSREDTASSHILEGAVLLKLLPKVDDLRYGHYHTESSPIGPVKLMVETFSLNRLRIEFVCCKSLASTVEKIETCLGLFARGLKASSPLRSSFVWELPKGKAWQWRDGGHLDDLDGLDDLYNLDADAWVVLNQVNQRQEQ